MSDTPTPGSEQKAASPANPQQKQQQGDNKPGTEKPASQPQQK